MDSESWITRLSSASKRYQSALQSQSDMFMGFEDIDEDDEISEEFTCPFCSEYFDIVGLCCHIDDEHPAEARKGMCPVCSTRVGADMVAHITLQHGNIFRISFSYNLTCFWLRITIHYIVYFVFAFCIYLMALLSLSVCMNLIAIKQRRMLHCSTVLANNDIFFIKACNYSSYFTWLIAITLGSLTKTYMQRKRKSSKGGSHSSLSLLRRELREGNLQSLFGGVSSLVSSTNAAPDPLLSSFILPVADDFGSIQSISSSDTLSIKKITNENSSERVFQSTPLSIKDQKEQAKRSEFVQGLLLSTFLDDEL